MRGVTVKRDLCHPLTGNKVLLEQWSTASPLETPGTSGVGVMGVIGVKCYCREIFAHHLTRLLLSFDGALLPPWERGWGWGGY